MARLSFEQQHRLKAIGIDVWVSRQAAVVGEDARVRLASGHGPWLLVQRQPWRGQFEALLADITATLGVDQCRFGQWANSQEAGVAVSELAGRGVRHLISFGTPPKPDASGMVIEVPTMQEIHDHPEARQVLWQSLRDKV